jgi:periplasmic divalent cation tolerance protein
LVQEENKKHMMSADSLVIVLTTLGDGADAEGMARALVEDGLAACVNILPPMTSVYRWKGSVERESERQLVVKTTAGRVAALESRVQALHPYELPEFLVLAAEASVAYADWVRSTGASDG